MDLEDTTQAFKNLSDGLEVEVVAHFHKDSNQHVVFWDDIQDAIPGVTSIRNGNIVVPRARNHTSHFIDPRCIRYMPGIILTVVVGELNPPNSDPARPRTPVPLPERDSSMYDDSPAVHTHAFPNYAASVTSDATTNRGPSVPHFMKLSLRVEGEEDSVQGDDETESVLADVETLDIRGSSEFRPSSGASNGTSTTLAAHSAINAFYKGKDTNNTDNFDDDNDNPANRSATPPLSTSSSSVSGTSSSGVSISTTIPPSSIDTATTNGTTTAAAASAESGPTSPIGVPEPAEIDPVEATSSWASIFRTLGDLQEQFQLAPEDTVKMFTEITQST
ncbi:MAG: hypothetical protein J3R72DRAFT_438462 [Linnemannia gamsii]|nr:MAG: hypothetical protein J3R72DRAFT_438462 [Linnemannia gamsii]